MCYLGFMAVLEGLEKRKIFGDLEWVEGRGEEMSCIWSTKGSKKSWDTQGRLFGFGSPDVGSHIFKQGKGVKSIKNQILKG